MKLNFTKEEYIQLRNKGMTPQQIEQLSDQGNKPEVHSFLETTANLIGKIFPGERIGEAVGTAAFNVGQMVQGKDPFANPERRNGRPVGGVNPTSQVNIPAQIGDTLKAGATIAGLKAPLPSSSLQGAAGVLSRTAQTAGTFGAIGGTQALGESLGTGLHPSEVLANVGKGAAISAGAGTIFHLLGEGIGAAVRKFGSSALEFSSGVPKNAIEQAAANPATAKAGLKMPVSEVRAQADNALKTLETDLNSELAAALSKTTSSAQLPSNPAQLPSTILAKVDDFAQKLGVKVATTPKGLTTDFSKSAIVNAGEQSAVKEAFKTIHTWSDFSPNGVVQLSQRIGALRDFDNQGVTRSSAIVGKLYGAVNDTIKSLYPEVSAVRTNYAKNKEVLDTISQVLNATKDKIGSQQSAVTRLDNIFKENRDLYLNAIRELSKRSGVDILSLLAGGEFQKLLPNYLRGLGGGAVVGLGASFVSPWALLLAPLFSPRGAGLIARNAQSAGKTTAALTRTAATKLIGSGASE